MENPYNGAAAYIRGNGANSGLRGTVTFLPHGENVLVTAQVEGLPKSESGFFALHKLSIASLVPTQNPSQKESSIIRGRYSSEHSMYF